MRPEVVYGPPENVRTAGSSEVVGPVGNQVLKRGASGGAFLFFLEARPLVAGVVVELLADVAKNRFTATMAFNWAENGVESAGKARIAACSWAQSRALTDEPSLSDSSLAAPVGVSFAQDLINGRRDLVGATSFVVSTFEDDATNASAAAAAKNAQLPVKRRYARILYRFGRGVFMEFR